MTTFTCKTCQHTFTVPDPEDAGDIENSPFACPQCGGFEWATKALHHPQIESSAAEGDAMKTILMQ